MGKSEIQIVHSGKRHSLTTIVGRQARGAGRHHVCTAGSRLNQAGIDMAILTRFLRVA